MQSKNLYYQKYLKYKNKYLNLQSQIGGVRPDDMSDETTEANYIRFVVTKDSSKKNEFLEELKTYALKDKVSNDLLSILITQKKNLKISVFESPTQNYFLIIISSHQDNLLIKLGNEYGFPRGFPIIWQPNKLINMYGFYPKFNNDSIKEDEFNKGELDNSIEINFNFKYSGFLGQVITFTIDGINYWTTCGKNSTNYKYSDIVYELIKQKMTPRLLNLLCAENIHFCGETISRYDQKHGAKTINEGLITTLVAKGHWLLRKEDNEIIQSGSIDKFITIYDQIEMQQFCIDHNLQIDSIFKITTYPILLDFMIGLNNRRNLITLKSFMEYWSEFQTKYYANSEIRMGNIQHEQILGNILEGLIIKLTINKGGVISSKTIKYKFPFYTSRTMLLRQFIQENQDQILETNKLPTSFFKKITDFVDRWVVNTENHKNYWRYILAYLYDHFSEYNNRYISYTRTVDNIETLIVSHIFIMDLIIENPEINQYKSYENYLSKFHEILVKYLPYELELYDFKDEIKTSVTSLEDKKHNIIPFIISLGPIGSGKSTISTVLEGCDPSKFKHIDGDILDLPSGMVYKLGSERNDYTIYKLVEQIHKNIIPILSVGGGQLISRDRRFTLIDYLNSIFLSRVTFQPIIVLPIMPQDTFKILEGDELIDFIDNIENNVPLKQLYNDEERFKTMFNQRYTAEKKPDYKQLFERNKSNYEIVINIISSIDKNVINKIILVPLFSPEYHDSSPKLKETLCTEVNKLVLINTIQPLFKQKRILVSYVLNSNIIYHHITLEYKKSSSILIEENGTFEYLKDIKTVNGHYHICPSKKFIDNLTIIHILINDILTTDLKNDMDSLEQSIKDKMILSLTKLYEIINSLLTNYNNFENKEITENINNQIGTTIKKIQGIFYKSGNTLSKRINDINDKLTFDFKKNNWYISFILFPGVFRDDLANKAHITVNPGIHKPDKMKTASQIIYDYSTKGGDKLIKLDNDEYYFDFNATKVEVNFSGLFYI